MVGSQYSSHQSARKPETSGWPAALPDVSPHHQEPPLLLTDADVLKTERKAEELRKEIKELGRQRDHLSEVANALESDSIAQKKVLRQSDVGQILYTVTAVLDGSNSLLQFGMFLQSGEPHYLLLTFMWGFCAFCFGMAAASRRERGNDNSRKLTPPEREAVDIYSQIERTAQKHKVKRATQIESLRIAKVMALRDELTGLDESIAGKKETLTMLEKSLEDFNKAQVKGAIDAEILIDNVLPDSSLPALGSNIREAVRKRMGESPYDAAARNALRFSPWKLKQ